VENVGVTSANPLKLKANAGVTWKYRRWTVDWTARYFDTYQVADPTNPASAAVILSQGNAGRVPSQVYHDFFASYRFSSDSSGSGARWLAGTEVQLGIKNVFNTKPPVDVSTNAYDYYSAYGGPRLATYYLSVKKSFGF
jgi:outer membrane receptor protein involved in Fe transport